MPLRYSGIEAPTIIVVLAATSVLEPGRNAASTPTGIERQSTTIRARMPNCIVGTSFSRNSSVIGILDVNARPRSPWKAL